MTFPIDITVPNINNDPADDVAPMNQNFINTKAYLSVDHVPPGDTNAGFHDQVTYLQAQNPGVPVDPISISYPNNAQTMAQATNAASSVVQEFYRNANGIFPVSAIKAFANFSTALFPNPATLNNAFNVTLNSHPSQNVYVFNIAANAVKGSFPTIFVDTGAVNNFPVAWSYAANLLTITTNTPGGPFAAAQFQFIILEI